MNPQTNIWAIVPCAGSGQRMQQSIPKQYLKLQGSPLIETTLTTLLAEPRITQITVCVAENDQFWDKISYALNPRVTSTIGGDTRAQSVLNGINSISDKAQNNDWLLVHDAARPCLSQQLLASFIEQLSNHEVGGIVALQSNDTVKLAMQSDSQDKIEQTLDRSRIWTAQTPQMFRYGLLKQALQDSLSNAANITDEASAMEMAGHNPKLIRGEIRNIKITRADDLEMANLLMTQNDQDKSK